MNKEALGKKELFRQPREECKQLTPEDKETIKRVEERSFEYELEIEKDI